MDAPPVRYVTAASGHSIAYTVSGSGRDLVLMPSTYNHVQLYWQEGSVFRHFMEEMAQRFRVVHYDGRGQGLSSRGLGENESRESYEQELEAVVDRTVRGKFVLVAMPFGHTAVRYAVQHQDRVAALVICNGRPIMSPLNNLIDAMMPQAWDGFTEAMARTLMTFEEPVFAKKLFSESMTREDRIKRGRHMSGTSIEALAPKLRMPVLLLSVRAGAWGFGLEEASRQLAAIIPDSRLVLCDDVSAGLYAPPGQTPPAIAAIDAFLASLPPEPRTSEGEAGRLSAREVEVLHLIATGMSNKQIAVQLKLSTHTVSRHASNIFAKIRVANRAEATDFAHRNGLMASAVG